MTISTIFKSSCYLPKGKLLFYRTISTSIMRLGIASLFVFFTSSQLFSAAPVNGQVIDHLEVNLEFKNESLVEAFKKIETKTSFYFMYRNEDVKDISNLNIPARKQTVKVFLEDMLRNTHLTYKQMDNRILIMAKADIIVNGKVSDTNGEPLPGVNISIKGTSTGTISDVNGNYSLSAPENGTLIFSFIGYRTQEVPVNSRTTINISMKGEATSLDEVVVTALGIKQRKEAISYSTQTVSTEELTEAREVNLINSLQGKVAGLNISRSGTGLGAESRVILRGNRSISGDSQPLYVVDGVPISGGISTMSPDNIASINVLKGPNAAALYGSDAQDGVIIIETRKGEAGKVNINLNSTFMAGVPIHYLDVQNVYGQGVSGVYNKSSEESWGPKMGGQMVDHWSPNPALAGTQYAFTPQPDNYKEMFQTSYNMSTSLNASVGTEKSLTAFNYTRTDAEGLMPNSSLGRNNLTLRVNNQLADWLTLDSKISFMQQSRDNPNATGDNAYFNPYRNLYRMPRNISHADLADFEYQTAEGFNRQNFWNPGSTSGKNPYWIMNRLLTLQDRQRVIGLVSLTVDFTENLSLLARSSYDGGNSTQERKVWEDTYGSAYHFGYYHVNKSSSELWNSDVLLSYKENISDDLSIDTQLGASLRKRGGEGSLSANSTEELLLPNFFSLSNTLYPRASFNPSNESETQSVYFAGNIGWKDALYLNVTGRNDWSSTLPAANRSYFYPSVGLSAVISELIPASTDLFSFARVRASWARVGNSAPAYMLSRTARFSAGGNNGFMQLSGVLPNKDLKPETTESVEVGLDMRFFEGRLGLDITAYKTNTFDQLFTVALPVGSGASSFFTNGGDIENKGIEVLLTGRPVQTSSFNWNINTNFSHNRNWVNRISDERPRVVIGGDSYVREFVVEQGHEFGDMYSRGWVRDEQGRVIVGSNGLPLITKGRTVKVANFNPDWTAGISNSFSYRNISASFLIEHRQGGTVVSMTNSVLYGEGVTTETLKGREGGLVFGNNLFDHETAVLEDGTPNNIEITAQDFWRNVGGRNTPVGEAFIEDATNTRLREVTLGFTLPQSLLANLPISNVKFSLVGRNLLFLYRTGNWDPEILTSTGPASEGFQSFVPPTERNYGVNLKIDF